MVVHTIPAQPWLLWLTRLRWCAVAGQGALWALLALLIELRLPAHILFPCLAVTAGTNVLLQAYQARLSEFRRDIIAGILLLDTVTMTVLLYFTGGAHNPFTAFYLLHITLAAITLPLSWTLAGVAVSGLLYGVLFVSPHELSAGGGETCCNSFDFHLQGMLLAMVMVGIFIAFFVGKLSAALARRERELARARLEAERLERFASLATLSAGVAHELATPLGTIAIASADLAAMANGNCRNPTCAADANLIRREVERCRRILESLGERATSGVGDAPEAVTPKALVDGLAEFLSPAHRAALRVDPPAFTCPVLLPRVALLQALAVLVKNACEAEPADGVVALRLERDGNDLVLRVRDNGCGMPPEVAARAGEPFFTTKGPGRGMGLGLFLVRTFAERLRGKLRIDSAPGRGTAVEMRLPGVFPEGGA